MYSGNAKEAQVENYTQNMMIELERETYLYIRTYIVNAPEPMDQSYSRSSRSIDNIDFSFFIRIYLPWVVLHVVIHAICHMMCILHCLDNMSLSNNHGHVQCDLVQHHA